MDKETDIMVQQDNCRSPTSSNKTNNIPMGISPSEADSMVECTQKASANKGNEVFDDISIGLSSIKQDLKSIATDLECIKPHSNTEDSMIEEVNINFCSESAVSDASENELTSSDQEELSFSDSFVSKRVMNGNNEDSVIIVSELLNLKQILHEFSVQIGSVQSQLSSLREQLCLIQGQLSIMHNTTCMYGTHEKPDSCPTPSTSDKRKAKKKWKLF